MPSNTINPNVPGLDQAISTGQRVTATGGRFLASASTGALIASLIDPYGAGSTFATVGSVPPQLALSGSTIVKGSGTAVAGLDYSIKVLATSADGLRDTSAILTFSAINGVVAPPTPTVYFVTATLSLPEGNSGPKLFAYTVGRSSTVGAATAPVTFSPGSTSASDWTGGGYPSGLAAVFADGAATTIVQVSANGDTDVEGDEGFGLTLAAPAGYALGSPATATGTMLNDDVAAAGLAVARPAFALTEFWNLWGDSTTSSVNTPAGQDYPAQLRTIGTGVTAPWHGQANTAGAAIGTGGDSGNARPVVGNGGTASETTPQIAARVTALQADATWGAEMNRPQIFSGGLNNYNPVAPGFSTTLGYGRDWPARVKADLVIEFGKIGGGKDWGHILAPQEDISMSGLSAPTNQLASHVAHRRDMIASYGRRVIDIARVLRDEPQPSTAGTTVANSGPDYAATNFNGMIPLSMRPGTSMITLAYNDAPVLLYNTGAAGAPASLAYAEGQIAFNQFSGSLLQYRKVGASGAGSWETLDSKHFGQAANALIARTVADFQMASQGNGPPFASPQEFLTTADVVDGATIGVLAFTGAATAAAITTDKAGTTPHPHYQIATNGTITRKAAAPSLTEGMTTAYAWLTNSYGTLRSVIDLYVDKPAAAAPKRFLTSGTGVPMFGRTSHGFPNGTQISGAFLIRVDTLADAPRIMDMNVHSASGAGTSAFFFRLNSSGFPQFGGTNAAGTALGNQTATAAVLTAGVWTWVLWSFDLSNNAALLYHGDTAKTFAPSFATGTVNFADTSPVFYAARAPQSFDDGLLVLKGGFGPAVVFPGFVDWSVVANRRALFDAGGLPVARTPFSAVGGVAPKWDTSAGFGGLLFGPSNPSDPQSLIVPSWRARQMLSVAP